MTDDLLNGLNSVLLFDGLVVVTYEGPWWMYKHRRPATRSGWNASEKGEFPPRYDLF